MTSQRSPRASKFPNALVALREDWTLYFYEAAELAAFMISACAFTVLLFDPAVSPIHNQWFARALMGLAMAATAIGIIKSPWGRRSGAHFNPAITLTFYRLGKIGPYDAIFYIAAHFVGGIAGVEVAAMLLGPQLSIPQVNYAVTVPGLGGPAAAFAAEAFMAALLMAVVLITSNRPALSRFTPWCVGALIALYILFLHRSQASASIRQGRSVQLSSLASTPASGFTLPPRWPACSQPPKATYALSGLTRPDKGCGNTSAIGILCNGPIPKTSVSAVGDGVVPAEQQILRCAQDDKKEG
jgi:aquaporin Z